MVEIKGRAILLDEAQLSPVDVRKRRAPRGTPAAPAAGAGDALGRSHAAASIDLHGMTSDAAVAALDAFLNDAILAGLAEVRVIHGRTGGRLKAAVHARLKGMNAVQSYHLDPANPGVTVVRL